ncbi:uncharacterized protein LOC107774070 [Nicotiana tabacum]|uniref:Uncharacterized protein LOC107774070 n=1 Tax=Nicotiana tabacum TaxID=4097 RepID=A0AC58RUG3_TOBAC
MVMFTIEQQVDLMKPFERKYVKTAMFQIIDAVLEFFNNGKSIIHNVLICHDILRHYNRKTTPRCFMKKDLRKDYDMVHWEFLEEALIGYGFPIKFTELIMAYVTSTKISISVNGESHDFKFHHMCKHLKLTYLVFAVDLMMLCKGERGSEDRVLEALEHFSSVSGLVANMDKSNRFMEGIDDHMKEDLLSNTGFSLETFPISLWGAVFVLPQSIMKEVDKKYREYPWGGSEEKKKKLFLVS